MQYSTGKPPCGQVLSVKVDLEDSLEENTEEFTTKDGVFLQVKENLSERFCLAFTAPSCSGALFDDIGFLGDMEAVQQILEDTHVFPAGTDPATELLLEETSITYSKLSQEEVVTYITADDHQYYWQRPNERISLSYSGMHFRHYKATVYNRGLSALHAANYLCVLKQECL